MGSPRLARQALSAAAKYERILGRALAATEKIGGRNGSGLAFRRADVAQKARLDTYRDSVPGDGDRRQCIDVLPDERRRAAACGGRAGAAGTRSDAASQRRERFRCDLLSRLP